MSSIFIAYYSNSPCPDFRTFAMLILIKSSIGIQELTPVNRIVIIANKHIFKQSAIK